jgi:hypothetical protein
MYISLTLIALAIAVLILWLQYPNIFSKDRQPVLMSGWFIPHVTAYMVSYALLASALTISVISKWKPFLEQAADMLTRLGAAFFLIGMLLGSLWAMNAWGSGWAWDIKESWGSRNLPDVYRMHTSKEVFSNAERVGNSTQCNCFRNADNNMAGTTIFPKCVKFAPPLQLVLEK